MRRHALLIGIDEYAFKPLSSCVNDAVAMRDMLVDLGLFKRDECTLMTSPAAPGSAEVPTRKAILDRLLPFYDAALAFDRLLVYFAGHGLSVRLGREADKLHTVMVPAGVAQLKHIGGELIDLDELVGRFARRGAKEQFWIIDACRNLPPEDIVPDVVTIGWDRPAPGDPRDWMLMGQAVLYAVAPHGEARATQGGHGLVTGHLLDGLACRGTAKWGGAAWYDEKGNTFLIDLNSLMDYASRRIGATMPAGGYEREYMLPQIWRGEKVPGPLRDAVTIPDRPFCMFIEPATAAEAVSVTLSVKRHKVAEWPPWETVPLTPDLYRLTAKLTSGAGGGLTLMVPDPPLVDVREVDRVVLKVQQEQQMSMGSSLALSDAPGVARPSVTVSTREPGIAPTVTVRAIDPDATVLLTRLSGGKERREAKPNERITLAEGLWRVEIRLGNDTIAIRDEDFAAGEDYDIAATAQITPALAALLPDSALAAREAATNPRADLEPSETIGKMQGAILPTLLPMLALKPLDGQNRILTSFSPRLGIPLTPQYQYSAAPAAVALAFDGAWDDAHVLTLASMVRVKAGGLARKVWQDNTGRVSLFLAEGVRDDSRAIVSFSDLVELDAAAPRLPGHCATVAITLWPDGRHDVSINLFALPPGEDLFARPGKLSRSLAIAARLYRAGATLEDVQYDVFSNITYGSSGDPVLGALAWFGRARRLAADDATGAAPPVDLKDRQEKLSSFLMNRAPTLSDSRIVAALGGAKDAREHALDALLDEPSMDQPVLADALSFLARHAITRKRFDHWSAKRFQRLARDAVFNVVRRSAPTTEGTIL